jgi:hypothetical protein
MSKTEEPAELDEFGVSDLRAEIRLAPADIARAARGANTSR